LSKHVDNFILIEWKVENKSLLDNAVKEWYSYGEKVESEGYYVRGVQYTDYA